MCLLSHNYTCTVITADCGTAMNIRLGGQDDMENVLTSEGSVDQRGLLQRWGRSGVAWRKMLCI